MRETMQAMQADLAPLTNKLAVAQKDAVKAALAKDADEKTVRAKIEAVAKVQTGHRGVAAQSREGDRVHAHRRAEDPDG